jgi:D-alanine-D-alanine ligase
MTRLDPISSRQAVHTQRIVVLAGGLSPEREVSLRSGHRVSEALTAAGHDVWLRDADGSLLIDLQHDRPDCVVPLLHGQAGEDGSLQELLELARVSYVGSPPAAARCASAKPVAKHLVSLAGICTPESIALESRTFREMGASILLSALVSRLGLPLIVKPAVGGSALGCSLVMTPEDLPAAMVTCFAFGPSALVERYVAGREVAVAVIETEAGPRALPAVEIRPGDGRYDYAARYTAGATEFVVPAELPAAVTDECARVALQAHRSLGLRDLSRIDLIVDPAGRVTFLEANISPGMTETSLLPLSIRAAGLTVGALFEELCGQAARRDPQPL